MYETLICAAPANVLQDSVHLRNAVTYVSGMMEKLSFLSSATSPDGYSKIEAGSPRNDQKATQNVEKRAIRALFATLWCLGARSVHYLQHFAALMRDPYIIYNISWSRLATRTLFTAFRGPESRSVHYLPHFVAPTRDPYTIYSISWPHDPPANRPRRDTRAPLPTP